MSGSIAYIKTDKLIGVPFQSGYIRFYHLGNRSLVFELNVGIFHTLSLCGLQYLPRKKIIVTNTVKAELKMWQYIEGERRVGQENIVRTKSIPYCVLANSDESQLIFHVYQSGNQYLESYDFDTDQTLLINLPKKIEAGNCLISLGLRAVVAADCNSGNICILNSKANGK